MFEPKSIVVIGAGTMGRGIAQWFVQQNIKTQIIDRELELAESSITKMESSWAKLVEKEKFTKTQVEAFKRNISASSLDDITKSADLVIEAIIENLEIKVELFQKLDHMMDEKTILASNTSSIPIANMAKNLSQKRKEQFLGLHFFNPAPIMKLVEIIKGPETSSNLAEEIAAWFINHEKVAAICKDSPGFIVNRIARNFYGEPLRIVNTHDMDKIKEVDDVMKAVGGFRMGPFELMDLIGIDINYDVTQSVWHAFFEEARFAPHPLQKQMVDSGRFGKKTNKGFYDYE